MSYDLHLEADLGNGFIDIKILNENYTYNMSSFLELVLNKDFNELNNQKAEDVLDCIEPALDEIRCLPNKQAIHLEPENKWGSVIGATVFLSKLAIACAKAPHSILRIN